MGFGDFLFGSSGGLDKKQKRLLYGEMDANRGYGVNPAFLDYARRTVEPGFMRARQANASMYANADAPISSGGRTATDIGLAGEEAGAIGQMTQEEIQRKQQRFMQILQLLSQGKPASSGFLGGLGSSFSFTKAI